MMQRDLLAVTALGPQCSMNQENINRFASAQRWDRNFAWSLGNIIVARFYAINDVEITADHLEHLSWSL